MGRQRIGMRRWSSQGIVVCLLLAGSATPILGKSDATPTFAPGPDLMTDSERARVADPATGAADAVILIEETKRVETSPGRAKVWYHVRAKIFSETGLGLATIEIPNVDEETKVQEWWGHVLTPAGKISRLRQDRLSDRIDPVTGERSIGGVLSRAAPGCVVDWGYVLTDARWPLFEVVRMQRKWPVDRMFYRWRRAAERWVEEDPGGFRLQHASPGMSVVDDKLGALLSAEHVPPGGDASLALWQLRPLRRSESELASWDRIVTSYWNDEAKQLEQKVAGFGGRAARLRAAMEASDLADRADLQERLRAAYAWIGENVKLRPSTFTVNPGAAVRRVRGRADTILLARVGTPIQRTLCFLSVARAMNVDASLVLTTEPRSWTWDRWMFLVEQFSHALVEVRVPGEAAVLVAVGSGLPYGQIPHEASGGKALRVTERAAEIIEIPPTDPR